MTHLLGKENIMKDALLWWDNLSNTDKRSFEIKVFGHGEYWEDNSLSNNDILNIFIKYKQWNRDLN